MVLVCGLNDGEEDLLARSLGGAVRQVPDLMAALRFLRRSTAENLVVVGPEVPEAQVLRFAVQARTAQPGTLVVLLRRAVNRLDRELGRRAGIAAVLPADDLVAAGLTCRELLAAAPVPGEGRMITVFGGKAGCGRTTIAVNLAVALADAGRRVCLVNLDLHSGDLAVTLGLEPAHTIAADPADLAAVVTPLRRGLDCALAPARPGEAERLESDGVESVLSALGAGYDDVVVDTPAAFTGPVMTALDRSVHHLLVTTPERPALQRLRRALDTLDLLGHPRDRRAVVFNRSDREAGITAEDVERLLHAPVAAHVPSSRDVAASINACRPLMVSSPDHPVSRAIRSFARARLPSPAVALASPFGGAMR